jgi:hypothetical protein
MEERKYDIGGQHFEVTECDISVFEELLPKVSPYDTILDDFIRSQSSVVRLSCEDQKKAENSLRQAARKNKYYGKVKVRSVDGKLFLCKEQKKQSGQVNEAPEKNSHEQTIFDWIIARKPKPGMIGDFYPYSRLVLDFGKDAKTIVEDIFAEEKNFLRLGIVVQTSVKTQGMRGIRIVAFK